MIFFALRATRQRHGRTFDPTRDCGKIGAPDGMKLRTGILLLNAGVEADMALQVFRLVLRNSKLLSIDRVNRVVAMISQKARYALQALIVLARHGETAPVLSTTIAKEAGVPHRFLQQIMLDLKKNALVASYRGRQGGYALARSATKITFADVICASDGASVLPICRSRAGSRTGRCGCPICSVLARARNATDAVFASETIAAVAAQDGNLD